MKDIDLVKADLAKYGDNSHCSSCLLWFEYIEDYVGHCVSCKGPVVMVRHKTFSLGRVAANASEGLPWYHRGNLPVTVRVSSVQ